MPYCRACGIEVGASTTFCPECGEELNFTAEPIKETETTSSTPDPESVTESTSEPEPELDIEPNTSPEKAPLSIWGKVLAVLCVPVALAGLFLELASVYTLATGGYTLGEFGLASVIFGLVTFLPIAYLYRIYTKSNVSLRGMV